MTELTKGVSPAMATGWKPIAEQPCSLYWMARQVTAVAGDDYGILGCRLQRQRSGETGLHLQTQDRPR